MFFNRFTDTIIHKGSSELRDRYNALTDLIQIYPQNKDLVNEYYMIKKGLAGEDNIEYQLKKSHIGMYVLRDIKVKWKDLTAQADFVVITPAYTYYIECKNLSGNIRIDENGNFIREYVSGRNKVSKGMYSPIRQVQAQKEVFRKIWENGHNRILTSIFGSAFDDAHKILVVAANEDTIINTKRAPKEAKECVLRADLLVKRLESDLETVDYSLSRKEMEKIADGYLLVAEKQNTDFFEYYKAKYVNDVIRDTIKREPIKAYESDEDLKKRLISFRKKRSSAMSIPAYYVFNNDELESLVKYRPGTVDELRRLNILSAVRINTHGKDIVDEINRSAGN